MKWGEKRLTRDRVPLRAGPRSVAKNTRFRWLDGSADTEAKKALRSLELPATTGADHVMPRSVDDTTLTTAWPLMRLLHATWRVPFGAMASDGKVRESWRKLEPGKGLTKSSVTVATVMFWAGKVAPPLGEMDRRSTGCLLTGSSQTTYTVPSGPTSTTDPWRPPRGSLLSPGRIAEGWPHW